MLRRELAARRQLPETTCSSCTASTRAGTARADATTLLNSEIARENPPQALEFVGWAHVPKASAAAHEKHDDPTLKMGGRGAEMISAAQHEIRIENNWSCCKPSTAGATGAHLQIMHVNQNI